MTTAFDGVRDIAQQRPLSIAACIIIAFPGSVVFVTGRSILLPTTTSTLAASSTTPYCTARIPLELALPTSALGDTPATRDINHIINIVLSRIQTLSLDSGEGLGAQLVQHFPLGRLLSVVVVTALPGIGLLTIQHLPVSRARRHQTIIVNVLHFIALVACANRKLEASDLLVVVFVMVAFDVFQRTLGGKATDTMTGGESHGAAQELSPETGRLQQQSVLTNSDCAFIPQTAIVDFGNVEPVSASQPRVLSDSDSKDSEILQLQRALAESRTADKAKEVHLRSTKKELHNARNALNDSFAEYTSLRDEVRTIKQNLGRDHQAIVYRKDIELFALRKGNEQKERNIEDRDNQLDDMARQHQAATELKDAQLKVLKERLISMERQSSPRFGQEGEEGGHALEVRILKVRGGRTSLDANEDKDETIARLHEQLSVMKTTNEEVVNQQAELQRAWDIAKKIQKALKEEREKHAQTKEQLDEAALKLSELEPVRTRANSTPGRLPTIDEDDHDKQELENMFDTVQQDNVRLYAENTALEKRLADANSKSFTALQETEALREQLRSEKAVTTDMETARPSVVHRVHFQRMEGQLAEIRDALVRKDEGLELLRNTIAEKDHYVRDLQAEVDAAITFHTQDQDEIERLNKEREGLLATKQQLMDDLERRVLGKPRRRVISNDRPERESARSSGATLIQVPEINPIPGLQEEVEVEQEVTALPPVLREREGSTGSIQQTPKGHLRSKSEKVERQRWSLITQDVPPAALREVTSKQSKRRSWGVRGREMVKKALRRDSGSETNEYQPSHNLMSKEDRPVTRHESRIRRALGTSSIRPSTSTPVPTTTHPGPLAMNPLTPTPSRNPRSSPRRRSPSAPRYYASVADSTDGEGLGIRKERKVERPTTSMGEGSKMKRGSWGSTTNKLKRRSLM